MAITSITIVQDNIQDGSNLLAVQSPVTFLAEAAWTTAAPDAINVEILDESDNLIDTYKAIPYADRTGVRTFAFQASLAIRSLLGSFDDFEQDADTWAYCEGLTGRYKIKFVDPATPATNDEVLIDFAHAARQFSEGCNMEDQFDNDTDFYLAPKDGVVYVYFYVANAGAVVREEEYTEDSGAWENDFEGSVFVEGYGAGGAGCGYGNVGGDGTHGGAGGQYVQKTLDVSPGDFFEVFVPGVNAGVDGEGSQGGDAEFFVDGNIQMRAKGGAPATYINPGTGSTTGGVGQLVRKGGNGASFDGLLFGAGGGAAGPDGNGGNAVNPNGGAGGGGFAGDGAPSGENVTINPTVNQEGLPGEDYGGGGSGVYKYSGSGDGVFGGSGAPGFVKISYLDPRPGFYRYKTTADQVKNIKMPTRINDETKQIIPLDTCTGDLVLKYLDTNGHYRFFNCNKYYATRDLPEKLGSINRFLTDILTDQSDSKNVGYRNRRTIEAVAEVQADYLSKFADLYTSPRVYLKVGSADEAKDWLLVEVRANDNIVRRRKANTGAISLTITLPEHYTISMI